MAPEKMSLSELLKKRGISDPSEFLCQYDGGAKIAPAGVPGVQVRGNVQLLLGQTITRDEVNARLAALRRL
ncbi:MAG: hypothetical protein HQL38_00550 [Alphaproteobacteria bacterium]|nr:hypothetical protein [Alphaproteobacteria bacterium]